ncbi:hypothetical protein EC973_005061 [Apophysomyces ossiformis]|uniref:Nicastrin n=1 Tax=Apophysomyces ossiformis TaxID=679940 RepID=A0A8H7BWG2_9FUNG|nr:hypothetical protein EC973_005061 [Apophysomyces ossiformis]
MPNKKYLASRTPSGILFQVDSQDDVDSFVAGQIGATDHNALVIPYNLLTRKNVQALTASGRVTGLIALLHSDPSAPDKPAWSPDIACPNCQYGLYANEPDQYVWNPKGIAYNRDKGYSNYPLQAVDFESFMWAAVNSETCLRRGWCKAVGAMSVYSTPSIDMAIDDNKPILVVAAAMDSRSLFHDLTVGANHDVSGFVGVLTVADALSRAPVPVTSLPKHILYTLFAAESWAFAGSQRFIQDISTPFQCTNSSRAVPCVYANAPCTAPCVADVHFTRINFDKIESIIELNSIGGSGDNYTTYWAHVDDIGKSSPLVDALRQTASQSGSNATIQLASSDGIERKLPPSSVMSFLAKNRNMQAVVLSDFQKELGSYYNNDLDDTYDADATARYICDLATNTARAIYNQAKDDLSNATADSISANCTLVATLMDCLVSNFSCPFMHNYFNVSADLSRISHYASVFNFENPQPHLVARFAFSFLGGVTGIASDKSCNTIQDCPSGEFCIKQKCTRTLTAYHSAYGTGLRYDDATGELHVVDPTKGTWTESTWNTPMFRVFLVMSKSYQIMELLVGIVWALISIVTVVFAQRYLKKVLKTD